MYRSLPTKGSSRVDRGRPSGADTPLRQGFRRKAAAVSVAAAAVTTLALTGWDAAQASTAEAAVTRAGSAAAAPQYVVLNCMDKAQVRPGTISLACADNGIGLAHLHWTGWTPELASAYGLSWENDCKPNCALGHIHYYPVVVMLWGSAAVRGHPGERRYTEATFSYTKGRPPVYVISNGKVVATYPVTRTLPLEP